MSRNHTHLDYVHAMDTLPSGFEDWVASDRLDWDRLRVCQECGQVGCSDQPSGRHATQQFLRSADPVIRFNEPKEDWHWSPLDQFALAIEGASPAPSHP